MSITNLGISSVSGGIDENARRTFNRTYLIRTTDLVDASDENAIIAAAGVRLYQPHPTYSRAYRTGIDVDLIEITQNGDGTHGALWSASCKYGPLDPAIREQMVDNGDGTFTFNPLSMKPRARYDSEFEDVPAWNTYNNLPIINSAGDFFDPPLMRQKFRGTLTVAVNQYPVNFAGIFAYQGKVNDSTWNGFDAKTVLVAPISMPEKQYDQDTGDPYYPMEYRFLINPDTWTRKVINAGKRRLDVPSTGTKRIPILIDGVPATDAVPLASSGIPLNPPITVPFVLLSFEIETPIDFVSAFGDDMANLS